MEVPQPHKRPEADSTSLVSLLLTPVPTLGRLWGWRTPTALLSSHELSGTRIVRVPLETLGLGPTFTSKAY